MHLTAENIKSPVVELTYYKYNVKLTHSLPVSLANRNLSRLESSAHKLRLIGLSYRFLCVSDRVLQELVLKTQKLVSIFAPPPPLSQSRWVFWCLWSSIDVQVLRGWCPPWQVVSFVQCRLCRLIQANHLLLPHTLQLMASECVRFFFSTVCRSVLKNVSAGQ